MSRVRKFLEEDVLTAAKARIRHTFDIFDSVAVCFSGGKDSLATLHLVKEVADELGIPRINAIFRDEELIPDEVIRFVDSYRQQPWLNLLWYCVPLEGSKYVLGRTERYVQWDPKRRHIRPKPPWAIRLPADDGRVFDQYTTDELIAENFKGKVAFVTGVRAAESLMRYTACTRKLNESYINASSTKRVSLVKPLYDWEENDVFRYFYEREIRYCSIYDAQLWAGSALRVSTPCHAENSKNLPKIKRYSPVLYDQLCSIFPEMLLQERYYRDLDRGAVIRRYGASYDGVELYILDNITDPDQKALALKRLAEVRTMGGNHPGRWPPEHVLKAVMAGHTKRVIQPLKVMAAGFGKGA